MNLLPVILIVLGALVVALNFLLLRWVGWHVRRLGRRVQVVLGLVAWLLETAVLAVVLLFVSGSMVPPALRAPGILNLIWIEASVAIALVAALVLLARLWAVPSLADVGLRPAAEEHGWRDLGVGLLLGPLAASIPLIVGLLGGWERVSGVAPLGPLALSLGLGALFFLATGVFEEVLYRGAFFALVARVGGLPVAWVISILIFSLLHGLNPGASLLAVLGVAMAAIALTLGLVRTGTLWLSIGFHTSWNWALGCLYGSAVSGIGLGSALQQKITSGAPTWATGGGFGPEASLPGIVAFGVVGVAIWLYTRRRNGAATLFPAGAPERRAPQPPAQFPQSRLQYAPDCHACQRRPCVAGGAGASRRDAAL